MSLRTFIEIRSSVSRLTLIPTTCLQKFNASTKPLIYEAGLPSSFMACRYSSTRSWDTGNGHSAKYRALYHFVNCKMLDPRLRMLPWLLFPKTSFISSSLWLRTAARRSKPLGHDSGPVEKIRYHFSRAFVMADSSSSLSDSSMFPKLMTSLKAPRIVFPCASWTDEAVWLPKASNSTGPMTGVGISFEGSLLKISDNPFRSQGILNLKVGLAPRQESVTIDFKFFALFSSSTDALWFDSIGGWGGKSKYPSHCGMASSFPKRLSSSDPAMSTTSAESRSSGKGNCTVRELTDADSDRLSESLGRFNPLRIHLYGQMHGCSCKTQQERFGCTH